MIREYPPLSDHDIDWQEAYQCLAMADFPIECAHVDHGSEPPMSEIWCGYCNLLAWYSRKRKDDIEGANLQVDRLEAERRVPLMAEGPGRFLVRVVAKFEAVIGRLEQDESVDKHDAYQLKGNLHHIRKIRGDVEGWAEAREAAIRARDACAAG